MEMRFSRTGRILAGIAIIVALFSLFHALTFYINPSLVRNYLSTLKESVTDQDVSMYTSMLPVEMARTVISLTGLVMIVMNNRNGLFIYLGSEMVRFFMLLIRGNIIDSLVVLAVPFIIIAALVYITPESEDRLLERLPFKEN